jgi:hypothetical protein
LLTGMSSCCDCQDALLLVGTAHRYLRYTCMQGYTVISSTQDRYGDTTRLSRRRSLDRAKLIVIAALCGLWGLCHLAVTRLPDSRYSSYPAVQDTWGLALLLAVSITTILTVTIIWSARILQDASVPCLLGRLAGCVLLMAIPWNMINFAVESNIDGFVYKTGYLLLHNVSVAALGAPFVVAPLLDIATFSLSVGYLCVVAVLLLPGIVFILPRCGLGTYERWTMSLVVGNVAFMFGAAGVPGTVRDRLDWCIVAGVVGFGVSMLIKLASTGAAIRKHNLGWEHWEVATSHATAWGVSGAAAAIAGLLSGSVLVELVPPMDPGFYNVNQDPAGAIGILVVCGLSALIVSVILG